MNSSPKRIFYLITDLDIGGAEKMLFELVQRIDRNKFTPEVGCLKGRGIVGKKLEALGIKVRYFRIEKTWDIYKLFGIFFFLRQGHFDILHSYLFHANIIGRVCGRMAGIPIIISSIRVCEMGEPRHLRIDKSTLKWADGMRWKDTITRLADMMRWKDMITWLNKIIDRMVDIEICVSKEVKNFTIEKAGIPEHKLEVVENGIS